MTGARLELSRAQILAFRRSVGALDERLPPGAESLRQAAWAGLSDSMPRGALLSIHARLAGTQPTTWEDPALVQVWGPRFSAYVIAREDVPVFTLGRLPDDPAGLRRATDMADRLHAHLDGRRMTYGEAGRAIGVNPNMLRYGATTGRILIRWDGARQPTVWTIAAPEVDPDVARAELARRYLHAFGPGTAAGFSRWAGIRGPRARRIFEALGGSRTQVTTPVGEAWILAEDEAAFRTAATYPMRAGARAGGSMTARLLPSGDTSFLLWGADRELLVPDARRRPELWTPRVWPGAVLLGAEIVGVWRRAEADVAIHAWRVLSEAERMALEAEASLLPLPDLRRAIRIRWDEAPA